MLSEILAGNEPCLGLDIEKPEVLFLGAAEGYEAIRNLKFGKEFDIVVSIGLIEHFPDECKHEAFSMHRRFLKPNGYTILTTPRNKLRSKAFYTVMSDYMYYGYRKLMDIYQMGLYAWEPQFRNSAVRLH